MRAFQLILISTFLALSTSKLAYVWQMVRHGARAPQMDYDKDLFTVAPGMLTQ